MITHPIHCPSIELNLIWNEKLFMIQKAYEINPFNSEWFQWIDAGICIYRYECPPTILYPDLNKVNHLPKDKFICSSSYGCYEPDLVRQDNYYHHISGTFLLHKFIIHDFINIYKYYLDKLVDTNNIWTDQVILTHIYKDYTDSFFMLCNGYGEIIRYLFS
jgi:hypothetical protein